MTCNKKPLVLFHQNINRFSGKLLDIELLLEKYNLDILCFTETWLSSDKMSFNIDNYVTVSAFNRVTSKGGGTLILTKSNIKFKERKDICAHSIERVCEVACAEIADLIIVCVYRPPASNMSVFLCTMEAILKKTLHF